MATLLVANPDGEPRRLNVLEDGETTIGRKSNNAIVIPDSHHAIMRFDRERQVFFRRDLGSHNGTRVNGDRLGKDEVALKESDSIIFGILEATPLPNRAVRSLAPKPLEGPAIEAPAPMIPAIDIEALRAATKKPRSQSQRNEEIPETVAVEEVCRELIKRLDLMGDG